MPEGIVRASASRRKLSKLNSSFCEGTKIPLCPTKQSDMALLLTKQERREGRNLVLTASELCMMRDT